jgi:hypothetical protein
MTHLCTHCRPVDTVNEDFWSGDARDSSKMLMEIVDGKEEGSKERSQEGSKDGDSDSGRESGTSSNTCIEEEEAEEAEEEEEEQSNQARNESDESDESDVGVMVMGFVFDDPSGSLPATVAIYAADTAMRICSEGNNDPLIEVLWGDITRFHSKEGKDGNMDLFGIATRKGPSFIFEVNDRRLLLDMVATRSVTAVADGSFFPEGWV